MDFLRRIIMEDFDDIKKRLKPIENDMARVSGLENDPNAQEWVHYGGLRVTNPPSIEYTPPEHDTLHVIPMNKEASDISYRVYIAGLKDPVDVKKNSELSDMLDTVIKSETLKGNHV